MKKKSAALNLRPLKLPPRTVATLANGLKVTIVKRGPLPLVSVRYITRAGSVFDPVGRFGLAELTARLLRRGAGGQSAEELNESVDYVGIVCVSLLLDRPLADYYLTYITDPATPFTAVVEMTAFIDPAQIGGHALVYLPKYTSADDPLCAATDDQVVAQFLD